MALQQPLIVFPALEETVDATSTVTFYLKVRGTQCIKYIIYLYDVETNTEQYTDTEVLGATLYDGDALEIDIDMSAIGAGTYYWKADLYWNADDYITTYYYTFNSSSPPTISFSPVVPSVITTPSYTFIGNYSQAEGVAVKNYEIKVYDKNGKQWATSGLVTSSPNNIRYTVNGLISGESYSVEITGATQQDVAFSSGTSSFDVTYIVPASLAHPRATLNPDSSVTINWGNVVSVIGTTDGSTSYENNFLYGGNVGLNLDSGASVNFELDFSAPFTAHWIQELASGFTGDFAEIEDTSETNFIYYGYDGTKFYLNINGDYYYSSLESLATNPYHFAIIHDGITISMYYREVV